MACGGQEALAAFTRQPADLVLLDLGMPRMVGFEVARRPRLLDGGAGCLVVALSGWAQAADRQRSLEAGFDGHLAKPVDSDLFQDLLENGIRAATRSAGSTGA